MAIDSAGVMALYIHGDLCFPSGFAVSFCGFRVRRPGMRFEPYFLCVVTPFCIYTCFVDLVGVTVLYRQIAIDSVGVMALYIHGDLLLSVRIPQGLKPLRCCGIYGGPRRPKAKALGYQPWLT